MNGRYYICACVQATGTTRQQFISGLLRPHNRCADWWCTLDDWHDYKLPVCRTVA